MKELNISKLKLAWKYLTGGMGSVADYLLDILNAALAKIDPANKAKIQAAFNIAQKVLNTLAVLSWLCPTKWQTAYGKTVDAVREVVEGLEDLNLTADELAKMRKAFDAAVKAWKSPDDETCVDCMEVAA